MEGLPPDVANMASPSTVKAARIDPVVTRGRMAALGAGAWQSFKDWTSLQGNPSPYGAYGKERYRPPPISTGPGPNAPWASVTGVPFVYSNHDVKYYFEYNDRGFNLDERYTYDIVEHNLADAFMEGDFGPANVFEEGDIQEAQQVWNSFN